MPRRDNRSSHDLLDDTTPVIPDIPWLGPNPEGFGKDHSKDHGKDYKERFVAPLRE